MSSKLQNRQMTYVKPVKKAPVQNQSKNISMIKRREEDTFDEVADMARTGYRLAKRIADLVNIETKCWYYQQYIAPSNPVPTPQSMSPNWSSMTPVILNTPAMGDEDFERISDSIKIQHCDIMFTLNQSGVINRKFRVVVFWDETNSTNTSSKVLETGFFGSSLITSVPKDWEEKMNTRILHDRVYTNGINFGTAATPAVPTNAQSSGHRLSFPVNLHTQFNEGSTTIVTGALKMFVVTDDAQADQSFTWSSRILYTDD